MMSVLFAAAQKGSKMFKIVFYIVIGMIGANLFGSISNSTPYQSLLGTVESKINIMSVAQANGVTSAKTVDTLNGVVVHVADGDTITLRTSYGDLNVRLFAIDAPEVICHGNSDAICVETGQNDGKESKLYLKELVLNRNVNVTLGHGLSYGRLVGTIYSDGIDVNLAMIAAGHAWHYKFFAKEQSQDDRSRYTEAEMSARTIKSGLWEENNPVPPWNWRSIHNKTFI